MRIEHIRIQNFRCLRDVTLDLEPLTVLVGPNGSGKTALLDALDLNRPLNASDFWRHQRTLTVQQYAQFEDGSHHDLSRSMGVGRQNLPFRYASLHLVLDRLRSHNQLKEERQIRPDGGNLANVFGSLPRKAQSEIAARLCELVPLYSDADVRPSANGQHRIVFQDRWDSNLWFEPTEVSDGTIVLLALLTLSYLDPAPDLVAIEEPEHALHPFLLGQLIGTLRDLANGKLGRAAVQVVLATHSPALLDFVEPREVRFVSRNLEDGSTSVRPAPLEEEQWREAYEAYEHSLGELWLSGGLGAVPGTPAA